MRRLTMNRLWSLILAFLLTAAIAACIGSCASGGTSGTASPQGDGQSLPVGGALDRDTPVVIQAQGPLPFDEAFPALPSDAGGPGRLGNAIYPLTALGNSYIDKRTNAHDVGTTLVFEPDSPAWRWAIY